MTVHLIRGLEGTGKTLLCEALSDRGYAAIDTDVYPELCRWVRSDTGNFVAKAPDYVDEIWVRSHIFIWAPERMRKIIDLYGGRTAFICGSATNVQDFYGVLGLRFYLWASDGIIAKRLQARDPNLWRYGSTELTRRLQNNRGGRTEAILDGSIVLNTELPIEDVVTDVIAYTVASNSNTA